MSEQFEMLVWRANGVDANGDIVTSAALLEMADGLVSGHEIMLNFGFNNLVGRIVQAWVRDNALYVSAVFTDCDVIEAIREGKLTLRPGFLIEKSRFREDGHRVIEKVGSTDVGLMSNGTPLPSSRICTLCASTIPDDDNLAICGPCLIRGYA